MTKWYNVGRFERENCLEDGGGQPGVWPHATDAIVGLYLARSMYANWPFSNRFFCGN